MKRTFISILLIFLTLYSFSQTDLRERDLIIGLNLQMGSTQKPEFKSNNYPFYSERYGVLGALVDFDYVYKKNGLSLISSVGFRTHASTFGIVLPDKFYMEVFGGTYGLFCFSLGLKKSVPLDKRNRFSAFMGISPGIAIPSIHDRLQNNSVNVAGSSNRPLWMFGISTQKGICPFGLATGGINMRVGKKWRLSLAGNFIYAFNAWQKGWVNVYDNINAFPNYLWVPKETPDGILTFKSRLVSFHGSITLSRSFRIKLYDGREE